MGQMITIAAAAVVIWYVLRSFRVIPSWRSIKITHGAKPWMAPGRTGTIPATRTKPERQAPRMTEIDRQGQIALMLSLGLLGFAAFHAVTVVGALLQEGADLWQAVVALPLTGGHVLACLAMVRTSLRFEQLIPVLSAPSIYGIHFDYGRKAKEAAAPEPAKTVERTSDPEPRPSKPNFELRLPGDDTSDDEEAAA